MPRRDTSCARTSPVIPAPMMMVIDDLPGDALETYVVAEYNPGPHRRPPPPPPPSPPAAPVGPRFKILVLCWSPSARRRVPAKNRANRDQNAAPTGRRG